MSIRQVLGSLNLGSIRGFLMSLYHGEGAGRKPYNPVCILKAQVLKYLWRGPSPREKLKGLGINFNAVLADAQYNSSKVREDVKQFGAEPVISYRRSPKVKKGLEVGKDFITRGVKRSVKLFRRWVRVERMFDRAKDWLLPDHLKVRSLTQAFIHICLSFSAMLIVALTALRQDKPKLVRSIKHYTAQKIMRLQRNNRNRPYHNFLDKTSVEVFRFPDQKGIKHKKQSEHRQERHKKQS